jgi:hypothetical protein
LILFPDKISGKKFLSRFMVGNFTRIFLGGKFFGKGVLKFLKGFLGLKEIWYLIALLVFDKGSGI